MRARRPNRSGDGRFSAARRDAARKRGGEASAALRARADGDFRTMIDEAEREQVSAWLAQQHELADEALSGSLGASRLSVVGRSLLDSASLDADTGRLAGTAARRGGPARHAPASPTADDDFGTHDDFSFAARSASARDAAWTLQGLRKRMAEALAARGLGAAALSAMLLQPLEGVAASSDLYLWELERVLEEDAGTTLSAAERACILSHYAADPGSPRVAHADPKVDCQALLEDLELYVPPLPPDLPAAYAQTLPARGGFGRGGAGAPARRALSATDRAASPISSIAPAFYAEDGVAEEGDEEGQGEAEEGGQQREAERGDGGADDASRLRGAGHDDFARQKAATAIQAQVRRRAAQRSRALSATAAGAASAERRQLSATLRDGAEALEARLEDPERLCELRAANARLEELTRSLQSELAAARASGAGGGGTPKGSTQKAVDPWGYPPSPRAAGGVAAFHERQLFWEVSAGGMAALRRFRSWVSRLSAGGMLSLAQVEEALRGAGYALGAGGAGAVASGLGCDTSGGAVDAAELLTAVEDMARGCAWYAGEEQPRASDLVGALYGGGGAPAAGGALLGSWSQIEGAGAPLALAEQEVVDQLQLLDAGDIRGFGRADAVRRPFTRRDPAAAGWLPAADFGAAVHELGLRLTLGEQRALAQRYAVPEAARDAARDAAPDADPYSHPTLYRAPCSPPHPNPSPPLRVAYGPFVRFVLRHLTRRGPEEGEFWGGTPNPQPPARGSWLGTCGRAARALRRWARRGGRGGGVARLEAAFRQSDVDGSGRLGASEFAAILRRCGIGLPRRDARALAGALDADGDGLVSFGELLRFLREGVGGTAWYLAEPALARRVLGAARALRRVRPDWLEDLRAALEGCADAGGGLVSSQDLGDALEDAGLSLSPPEAARLAGALDPRPHPAPPPTPDADALLDFLEARLGRRARAGAADAAARKIRLSMGSTAADRRLWLAALRHRFFSSDRFRSGVLSAPELLGALRAGGVALGEEEARALLEGVGPADGASEDVDGGIAYREVLRFCARHAGAWWEQLPELAGRLRAAAAARRLARGDVDRAFREGDPDGAGHTDLEGLEAALVRLGLYPGARQAEHLAEAIDPDGRGRLRYPEVRAFLLRAIEEGGGDGEGWEQDWEGDGGERGREDWHEDWDERGREDWHEDWDERAYRRGRARDRRGEEDGKGYRRWGAGARRERSGERRGAHTARRRGEEDAAVRARRRGARRR